MSEPNVGPLTDALFVRPDGTSPPALAREWHAVAREPGDLILLWAGAVRCGSGCLSWAHLTAHAGEKGDAHPDPVTSTPPEHIERMLSPLAHASRVRILQVLHVAAGAGRHEPWKHVRPGPAPFVDRAGLGALVTHVWESLDKQTAGQGTRCRRPARPLQAP